MAALELFGRRWLLRAVWELREGPLTFRALQERCGGLSPSVLNARLADLREAGLASSGPAEGYALTPRGKALLRALEPLQRWAAGWARELGGGA